MGKYGVTREEWVDALRHVQALGKQQWKSQIEYELMGDRMDHGCPPPLEDYQDRFEIKQGSESGVTTNTTWNGERVLWAYPAVWKGSANAKERVVTSESRIPTACGGVMMWAIIHALKELGLEEEIPRSDIETMKRLGLQDKDGIAAAFVELGWAPKIIRDVSAIREGDVLCLGYFGESGGSFHHWCIAREKPHQGIEGKPVLWTWGSSPDAGGYGPDWYSKNRTRTIDGEERTRMFVAASPFSD